MSVHVKFLIKCQISFFFLIKSLPVFPQEKFVPFLHSFFFYLFTSKHISLFSFFLHKPVNLLYRSLVCTPTPQMSQDCRTKLQRNPQRPGESHLAPHHHPTYWKDQNFFFQQSIWIVKPSEVISFLHSAGAGSSADTPSRFSTTFI